MENKPTKKAYVWLCTNGTLLNHKINKYLSDHGISIGISIDGPKDVHDSFRVDSAENGTFEIIENNYKELIGDAELSSSYKDVWGLGVVNAQNYKINDNINNFINLGIRSAQLKFARLYKNDPLAINMVTAEEIIKEYDIVTERILDEASNDRIEVISLIANDNDYYGKIIKRLFLNEIHVRRCWAGENKITICPDGSVYPCDSFVGEEEYCMGNIKKLDEVKWNIIRNGYTKQRIGCKSCCVSNLCGGDCFYNSKLTNGDTEKPDEVFCRIEKELCKMAIVIYYTLKYECPNTYRKILTLLTSKKKMEERIWVNT